MRTRRSLAGLGVLLFVCAAASIVGAAPRLLWEYRITGSARGAIYAVTTDMAGDCYALGFFYGGTIRFSATNSVNANDQAVHLFKLSRSGILRWARKTPISSGIRMCLDEAGNAIVGGYGPTNVVKYSPDGRLLWAKQFSGAHQVRGLAPAPEGGCYLMAETQGAPTVNLGSITLTNNGGFNLCIARLNAQGDTLWAQWCALAARQTAYGSITPDHEGNVIYALLMHNTGTIGPTNITPVFESGLVVAKFNPSGSLLWARTETKGEGYGHAWSADAMGTDATGAIFVTGDMSGVTQFDDLAVSSPSGGHCSYVLKLDRNGRALALHTIGPEYGYILWGTSLTVLPSGRVQVCAGSQDQTMWFGNLTATNSGGRDGYLARLNISGEFDRIEALTGSGSDFVDAVTADKVGNLFVTTHTESLRPKFMGRTLPRTSTNTRSIIKVATEEPPPLEISRSSNHVTLRWSALAQGFHVETASSTNFPLKWTRCAPTIRTVALTNVVTLRRAGDNRYFRLRRDW